MDGVKKMLKNYKIYTGVDLIDKPHFDGTFIKDDPGFIRTDELRWEKDFRNVCKDLKEKSLINTKIQYYIYCVCQETGLTVKAKYLYRGEEYDDGFRK